MKYLLSVLLILCSCASFSQTEKKMKKNFSLTISQNLNNDYPISFERKNPDKHGWDDSKMQLESAFSSIGFKVLSSDNATPHYTILIDYDYGYMISTYKMQYSNLRGTIVDASNNNTIIGSFTYTGRYDNDELAKGFANKLKEAINKSSSSTVSTSKESKLKELKELLDKKLITQEDYDNQKQKILNQ